MQCEVRGHKPSCDPSWFCAQPQQMSLHFSCFQKSDKEGVFIRRNLTGLVLFLKSCFSTWTLCFLVLLFQSNNNLIIIIINKKYVLCKRVLLTIPARTHRTSGKDTLVWWNRTENRISTINTKEKKKNQMNVFSRLVKYESLVTSEK